MTDAFKNDVDVIPPDVIIIVAVGSSIQFDEPFNENLTDPESQTYITFVQDFQTQIEPLYNETEGFQGIDVTGFEPKQNPSNKRRAADDKTVVNYEVNYDYKELQIAGGIDVVIDSAAVEQAMTDGSLTLNGQRAVEGSFVQQSQEDINREAAEKLLPQIDGDLCKYRVTNCSIGYKCVPDKGTCISKCKFVDTTVKFCSNEGTCVHLEDSDVFCKCDHDPTGFYMGERCEFYASQPLVIGLGAGAGGLILIIIIALSVCLCCRRKKKDSDFERQLTSDNAYWSPDEKVPMTEKTDSIHDEMPLYSMVNKRQTYFEDSSGSEKNNLKRESRLSSQDGYVMPSRERSANNSSFLHGNLQTYGGHDNRAFDWRPSVANVPIDQVNIMSMSTDCPGLDSLPAPTSGEQLTRTTTMTDIEDHKSPLRVLD
ncbi:Mucin-12 [Branchiostoma belcheri]|nr:Mucin-12 [Branchiostoma belcheri]